MATLRRILPHTPRLHHQSRSMSSAVNWTNLDLNGPPPLGAVVEPLIPAFIVARFCAVANHGHHWEPRPYRMDGQKTPAGPATRVPPMSDMPFWAHYWTNPNGLPAGLPPVVPSSPDLRRPCDRVMEALGSTTNPYALMLMQDRMQKAKNRLESYTEPMSSYAMRSLLHQANTASDPQDIDDALNALMSPLHHASAVFEFSQDPEIKRQIQGLRALVATQLGIVEQLCPDGQGLVAHWDEFFPYYFSAVSGFARRWARGHIMEIKTFYLARPWANARNVVLEALEEREDTVEAMRYGFELEE